MTERSYIMVDKIYIQKAVNGYVVSSSWMNTNTENTIIFKNMADLVKHLDDCFVKPYKEIKAEQLSS